MVARVLLRNRSSNTPTSARTWGNLWGYKNGTTGARIRPIVKLRDKQTSKSITSKTIDEYDHKKYNYWLLRLPLSLPLVGKGGEGGGYLVESDTITVLIIMWQVVIIQLSWSDYVTCVDVITIIYDLLDVQWIIIINNCLTCNDQFNRYGDIRLVETIWASRRAMLVYVHANWRTHPQTVECGNSYQRVYGRYDETMFVSISNVHEYLDSLLSLNLMSEHYLFWGLIISCKLNKISGCVNNKKKVIKQQLWYHKYKQNN